MSRSNKWKRKSPGSAVVLIDFGYLEKIAKKLTGLEKEHYNLQTLAVNLCKKVGLWCEEIFFFYAPPYQSSTPTPEQIEMKKSYDSYIKKITRLKPLVTVREGRLQRTSNGFSQKGVDTLFTYDLLRLTQRREHDAIILITADTDFAPIISSMKEDYTNCRLILAFYTDRVRGSPFSLSNHLWKVFEEKIIISRDDFFMQDRKEN